MTIADLVPLLKLYEKLYLENLALRRTLEDFPDWNDATVNGYREQFRKGVAEKFAVLYELSNNPVQLNAVLEGILQPKKRN